MEVMIGLAIALVIFALAAVGFGADSRTDDVNRQDNRQRVPKPAHA